MVPGDWEIEETATKSRETERGDLGTRRRGEVQQAKAEAEAKAKAEVKAKTKAEAGSSSQYGERKGKWSEATTCPEFRDPDLQNVMCIPDYKAL